MPSGIFCDLTYKRFGRLLVMKRLPNLKGKVLYECLCDCGNLTNVRADSLAYKKKNNTRSCGCLQKEAASRNGKKSRKAPGMKLIGDLFTNYKRRAKMKGIEFSLTRTEFEKFIFDECSYCGEPYSNVIKHPRIPGDMVKYNGIDRVDSHSGYVVDNCVSCCVQCNLAKNDYSKEEFYKWIKKTYKNIFGG